jgi:hypothetical protein
VGGACGPFSHRRGRIPGSVEELTAEDWEKVRRTRERIQAIRSGEFSSPLDDAAEHMEAFLKDIEAAAAHATLFERAMAEQEDEPGHSSEAS